ncbi:MAG: GIY-YIG nuclease family protein [Trueperaceae bacterium]|nr:GIY-YIG nuclease family protein [Trueperaceae bacterium]
MHSVGALMELSCLVTLASRYPSLSSALQGTVPGSAALRLWIRVNESCQWRTWTNPPSDKDLYAERHVPYMRRSPIVLAPAGIEPSAAGIYAIRDPRTLEVVYVGRSENVELRAQKHLGVPSHKRGQARLQAFVRKLRREGFEPVFEFLEVVGSFSARAAETQYIRRFEEAGHPLLNTQLMIREAGHDSKA